MRIIAGTARSIRLGPVPPGVRPTSDRVRESVFNSLGQFFDGGAVLDVYAGTGALGIEALSRGAERVVFIEKNPRAVTAIRDNLRRAGFEERAEVIRDDARRGLVKVGRSGRRFSLIFADPPYRIGAGEFKEVLNSFGGLLEFGGRVVVETGEALEQKIPGRKGASRRYGDTVVTIFDRSELTMNIAVVPGSFDPITVGHLDIIRRASNIFDHVVVAIGGNIGKNPKLAPEGRAELIEQVLGGLDNVSVEVMQGLLVNFAREKGARSIVKGLRAVSDFDSEFEQAQLNRTLNPRVETVFIMSSAEHSFLSSSAVREIAGYGGDVSRFVPEEILDTVRETYAGAQTGVTTPNTHIEANNKG